MLYKKRIADTLLKEQLEAAGAVLIQGPKWCGKTTTAEQIAGSKIYMNAPDRQNEFRMLVDTNIQRLLGGETPRLIDEWQLYPKLWDAVRYEVDHREVRQGQFVLTGSAVPVQTDLIRHTGTGRFAWLKMRTMSLWESGESNGGVSLGELFKGLPPDADADADSIDELSRLVCRGGWPESVGKKEKAALRQAYNYTDAIAESDISRVDGVRRDAAFARRLLRSYARHQGAAVPISQLYADINSNEGNSLSEATIEGYLRVLRQIFVIEDMPAWNPNLRSRSAIRMSETRYFTDPSIAVAALGIGPDDLLNDVSTFGLLFETMAVRDLRVYAESLDGSLFHFRDRTGLECDAVVHLRNGSYGLIEIKLGGEHLINEGAASLKKLASLVDTSKMPEPSFMMVLTGVGKYAYRRPDGVDVVPIRCLKP
ncbi:MAG: ATP-binding protein [Bacteroidales bacterium]|jgi:predicted AAA+ superfamily ATPase|nr:ATP-binding protein [Bacteroidales bacterium]MBR4511652.1 ATP-binding protein [Bacteroidales bacterium]